MQISIVMAVYNGEKYIVDQLCSLLHQSKEPDEVIIFDDQSKDNTVKIISRFIEKNGLKKWRLVLNKENKGWRKNFIDGMFAAHGEIIFFCDQDDVWMSDKIEVMEKILADNENIVCLSCKAEALVGDGRKEVEAVNCYRKDSGIGIRNIAFRENFNSIVFLGCTMCVRKEFLHQIKNYLMKDFGYDVQICRHAMLKGGMYTIDVPLIKHRVHGNNASMFVSVGKKVNYYNSKLDFLKRNMRWLELFQSFLDEKSIIDKYRYAQRTHDFLKLRIDFFEAKSILTYLKLLKYIKFYSGFKEYLSDFFYCFGIKR